MQPDYLAAIRSIEPGIPGALVSTYHGEPGADRGRWSAALIDTYHRFSLRIFISILYRFSLTDPFIRR